MGSKRRQRRFPSAVAAVLVGFVLALFGVYWDDAWHTDRGRDDLLSPPHLSLYMGVALIVGVVIWWGRRRGDDSARRSGPVGLAVMGAVFTLASAPIDEWWHQVFGRDAVLWSPPHLAAVAGTIAMSTGVALTVSGAYTVRRGALAQAAVGAGVIGAWQILVLEYDTDVAQFSSLWYLPAMAGGLAAASVTLQAAASRGAHWPATSAGLIYTLAMAGVLLALRMSGFSTPIIPLVVPALLVADLGRRLLWAVPLRATSFVAMLFATYWPYLGAVPGGVQPTPGETAIGTVLTVGGVAGVLAAMDPAVSIPLRRSSVAIGVALAIAVSALMLGPPRAEAHDPGQGEEIADVTLVAEVADRVVTVEAILVSDAAVREPVRIVARRGGRILTGPLVSTPTGWAGEVRVDQDGRWFIYVEARRERGHVEAWVPVIAGSTATVSKATALYVRDGDGAVATSQVFAGVFLFVLVAALIGRTSAVVRTTLRGSRDGALVSRSKSP